MFNHLGRAVTKDIEQQRKSGFLLLSQQVRDLVACLGLAESLEHLEDGILQGWTSPLVELGVSQPLRSWVGLLFEPVGEDEASCFIVGVLGQRRQERASSLMMFARFWDGLPSERFYLRRRFGGNLGSGGIVRRRRQDAAATEEATRASRLNRIGSPRTPNRSNFPSSPRHHHRYENSHESNSTTLLRAAPLGHRLAIPRRHDARGEQTQCVVRHLR